MTTNLTNSDYIAILSQVATTFQARMNKRNFPTPESVVNALLQAEKITKQNHLTYSLESLLGQWQLCFTTSDKVNLQTLRKKGFYLPQFAPAQISFAKVNDSNIEIGNQVQLGSFLLRLTGLAKYSDKKNLLAFDFTKMQISLFSKTLYQGKFPGSKFLGEDFQNISISKLAFFTFFLVTEDFIAARGRGGGLAIWVHEKDNLF